MMHEHLSVEHHWDIFFHIILYKFRNKGYDVQTFWIDSD